MKYLDLCRFTLREFDAHSLEFRVKTHDVKNGVCNLGRPRANIQHEEENKLDEGRVLGALERQLPSQVGRVDGQSINVNRLAKSVCIVIM